jgi:hypothetical protein
VHFKPSGIIHDLRALKRKYPHISEAAIVRKYKAVFQEMALKAKNKEFLPLLAKRYTGEALEKEYPAQKPPAPKPAAEPLQQTIPAAKPKIRERFAFLFRKMLESNEMAVG